jgi:signal recognition particle receptor subunit beta
MDFGRISISDDVVLYLFGTPGQERFSFMWETLSEGMLGFVLMVDTKNEDSITDGTSMIEFFTNMSDVPFVVAANKADPDDPAALEGLRAELGLGGDVPLLAVDARDKESVKAVLLGLLYRILESMG